MYAIIDVETTGGKYNEEGITEIAIYRYDGNKVVDQFASLINPEKPIQPFVVQLTGINNKMLEKAPKFYEVAKRVLEIMDGALFVAHNAGFDYRMLRLEFDRLGYDFQRQTLCTVELAQKLLPDEPSYSLGKLVRSLGIPITDRHRASGDAMATVKLLDLLISKDQDKEILGATLKTTVFKTVNPNLKKLLDDVPSSTGVYYLYDRDDQLIYVGKSRNMRKHLTKNLTSEHARMVSMSGLIHKVTFEKTGNELLAILKEHATIVAHKPAFNKAVRKKAFTHAWYLETTKAGYDIVKTRNAATGDAYLSTFSTRKAAIQALEKVTIKHELCNYLNGLEKGPLPCSLVTTSICKEACLGKESPESYNQRLHDYLKQISFVNRTLIIKDRGRTASEQSVLYVENGIIRGYAYVDLQIQFKDLNFLKKRLTALENSPSIQHHINTYIRHKHNLQLIDIG